MSLPHKALIAISSVNVPFYQDGKKTGLFYGELAHPYHVFTSAGWDVDFVSETGTYGIDEHSIAPDFLSEQDIAEYNDKESTISKLFAGIKKASDVDAKDYGIFFASAGHATLFDYPTASTLQKLASQIYANGGVVSAVCHGPAIFANLNDSNGVPLIKGKKVTAFTDVGEDLMQLTSIMKEKNLKSCEEIIAEVGGVYVNPSSPFDDFTVTDGKIVTGVNPASAGSTAKDALKAFSA